MLTGEGGIGGERDKSYDREIAWSSINHSKLSVYMYEKYLAALNRAPRSRDCAGLLPSTISIRKSIGTNHFWIKVKYVKGTLYAKI